MSSVGVDIGGTFTDLVGWRDGRLVLAKTSTTPADPTLGVATSLHEGRCDVAAIDEFLHGSTIAINTVLERKGAATALITTAGFRDVYAIGRGNRIEAFNLFFHRPKPLIPRERCLEVRERMSAAGAVLTPLDEAAVRALGARLVADGVESVAVCFLHAWANPAHEAAAGRILRAEFPQLFVTLSHEILRAFREYERTSTTALNAYVGPRVGAYLDRLQAFLRQSAFRGPIRLMRSNGGAMSIGHALAQPVAMMESGPVAGMIGAGRIAALFGLNQAIGFDMGGTTAKASLMIDGAPAIEEGYYIGGAASGQPMQLPVVDIVEVGAGGGSIAWRDGAGSLHVGPHSAGADPGPACYGKGGADPVVTDADLLLGRLNGARFLGGGMALDPARAEAAVREAVAGPLRMSVPEAALGIVRIADAAMALAVRAVSVNKGVDPRDAAMIAFGGAGPLHAVALAKEIFIPTVVVPKLPGNFSAFGMLLAPWRQDFVRTLIGALGALDRPRLEAAFAELRDAGERQLADDGIASAQARFEFAADLRYRGQEHAIAVPVAAPADLTHADGPVRQAFDRLHDQRYGHAEAAERIEMVNLRLTVTADRADAALLAFIEAPYVPEDARPEERRAVVFDDPARPVEARVLWRPGLAPGFTVEGPAVIEERNSTTLVHPGDVLRVSPHGHLVIDVRLEAVEG
ncbi:MAG: hydantoinase/oxoprolinase family protein [Rhodospirillales bacterium]